jgi:CheY-like chemotaxis protein
MPDVILMDMSLPVLDGWEATRRLKRDPLTAPIPVLALTAHALPEERERCLAAGCDEFDTKPVEMSRLEAKLAALRGSEGGRGDEERRR